MSGYTVTWGCSLQWLHGYVGVCLLVVTCGYIVTWSVPISGCTGYSWSPMTLKHIEVCKHISKKYIHMYSFICRKLQKTWDPHAWVQFWMRHFSQWNAWPIQPQVTLTNERLGERRDFLPKLTCQTAYHQACEYMQQQVRKQVRILSQREGISGACRPMWTNAAKNRNQALRW